jgi:molybdopterin-guanine dinucleotide biosynthesis protein A
MCALSGAFPEEAMMGSLSGLVLCGGGSRRMGRDKALLQVGGELLVLRVARRVGMAASPVMLATGTPGRLGDMGYPEVEDELPGTGPLSGLVAGLAASPTELLAAVAVDMPFVSPEVLRLLSALRSTEDAVLPAGPLGIEPLHAVYSRHALPALREALFSGRLGLREALAGLRLREVAEEEWREADPTGRFLMNLNRVKDFASLEP